MEFLFFLIVFSFNSPFFSENKRHDFHISKTDMVFKAKEKSVQMTMHIFIDDLEKGLNKLGNKELFIGTPKERKEANELIVKYLQSKFLVKINNKNISFDWVGKEITKDQQALWIYLEVKNVKEIKNIYVENRVLTDVFKDQKNIVQVNVPNKKQGYFLLDVNKVSDSAEFWFKFKFWTKRLKFYQNLQNTEGSISTQTVGWTHQFFVFFDGSNCQNCQNKSQN